MICRRLLADVNLLRFKACPSVTRNSGSPENRIFCNTKTRRDDYRKIPEAIFELTKLSIRSTNAGVNKSFCKDKVGKRFSGLNLSKADAGFVSSRFSTTASLSFSTNRLPQSTRSMLLANKQIHTVNVRLIKIHSTLLETFSAVSSCTSSSLIGSKSSAVLSFSSKLKYFPQRYTFLKQNSITVFV